MEKKKIIIISISVIVVLLIAGGLIWYFTSRDNSENTEEPVQESKTMNIYKKLQESEGYKFTRKIDDDNQITIAKKGELGYEQEIYNGETSNYVVREGDLYLLNDSNKAYYKYQNNDEILYTITNAFSLIEEAPFSEGEETINDKNYKYEEFQGIQDFLIDTNLYTDNTENVRTRFYYSGNNLKYIKTIVGDQEELLEIDIEYKADDSLFEIPEDYTDGDKAYQEEVGNTESDNTEENIEENNTENTEE